ncbi:glycosyltransferase [uncultured Methanobrevibacter sp.]|uniref:glycosyltransferase n=1 Tax=uncultured Methanobrevibacter sp. TaxID=253161 RepID=UPI0034596D6B
MLQGWDSHIAYGRWANPSQSYLYHIGSMWDERWHGLQSRLFDNHGLASRKATQKLIEEIKRISPDIIHLHNIHGYYLNYPLLFNFLSKANIPIVWTLHDCWPLTGHCSHFMFTGCEKWKTGCFDCCEKGEYPASLWLDNSNRNYALKRNLFNSVPNLTLITVSDWLSGVVGDSFLKEQKQKIIYNGIDVSVFRPCQGRVDKVSKQILAVASKWTDRKGLPDILQIRHLLPADYSITIVGLTKEQVETLPAGIIGITRTNSVGELADYYSKADVFINPTYEDNFPTTNLEALACGTPVITYRTGGSPEAIDEQTGLVVETGDVNSLAEGVLKLCKASDQETRRQRCRQRAVALFNKNDRYQEYLDLYNSLLKQ